jgi:predicted DsbA family dithiol-disulfide isomerase
LSKRLASFDTGTLVRLAEGFGLDRSEVGLMVAGDTFKKDVEAEEAAAREVNALKRAG